MGIHPLSVVHPSAKLGRDCEVGPFCVIERDVVVGDRCTFESHATVRRGVVMGDDNRVSESSVLGGLPQHLQARTYDGKVRIGSGNTFREFTTVHRSLHADGETIVGNNNFLMVNAHIAHDCIIADHTIIANNSMLGGHVTVDDRAFISGGVAIHQNCRIGRQCMIAGTARVTKDVPPFVTVDGSSNYVVGLNSIGLRRSGVTSEEMLQLKLAYRLIYRSCLPWREILSRLATEFAVGPAAEFARFFEGTKRGIVAERRLPPGSTIKLATTEEAAGEAEDRRKAG
ncbi:MAG: acyl-ACP--UDP-N-acetylglucosamine O-acyltransferase [Planctomycetia bacterium]|nr:acyl-ACP--UDP-N-acetylglucosamine O-acyltransferase [Planctomycetia bacterium]